MTELAEALFFSPKMAAVWAGEALVESMLAFEAALARAEAQAGLIPAPAAEAIASACRIVDVDVAAIWRAATPAGTPAIPLVHMLTERVAEEARGYVHWGATSQDVIDTALVLRMREGLDVLGGLLMEVAEACAALAERHRATPMAGRTLLQQALPITFGLKAARWLGLVVRQARRLGEVRAHISVVQLGGAAGTLASLGEAGMRVTELLAEQLGLAVPELPWHAERDRIGEVAGALGVVAGAMAKIADDLVLLAQTEVGEATEAPTPGKGGSSALPQKRNPVDAMEARAAARLALGLVPVLLDAMAQEHERAAGAWQAEWAALPDLFRYTSGAVDHVRAAVGGLQVNSERMRENLERSGGLLLSEALVMALASRLGRHEAQRLVREVVEHAADTRHEFRQAAVEDERIRGVLSKEAITRAFEPTAYLGSTNIYIDRALDEFRTLRSQGGSDG